MEPLEERKETLDDLTQCETEEVTISPSIGLDSSYEEVLSEVLVKGL